MAVAVAAGRVSTKATSERALGTPFWRLWTAATVSNLGDGFALVAFPLLAATLTPHAGLIAGVVFAQRLPWLFFALPAGALADRLNRGTAMAFVDTARTAVLVIVTTAVATDTVSIPLLYGAAFVLGSFETLFAAASHAAVPAVVAEKDLDRANGYLFASETAGGELVGPALGGLLFAVSASVPFLGDGISFLFSAVLLVGLRSRLVAPARTEPVTLRADMKSGISFFRVSPILRLLAVLVGGLALCQAMVMSVLVVYGLKVLDLSIAGYGVFLAAGAVGSVLGGLAAGRVKAVLGTAGVLIGSATLAAASYVLVGATSSAPLAGGLFVVETFAVACGSIASLSLRQVIVPDELRGRVGNLFRMCIWGVIPLGALAGGIVAQFGGLRAPFLLAGAAQLVLTAAIAGRIRAEVEVVEPRPQRLVDVAGVAVA
jgi:MFS family permease